MWYALLHWKFRRWRLRSVVRRGDGSLSVPPLCSTALSGRRLKQP